MSSAQSFPLEGDGVVENLFYYLWCRDDAEQSPRVYVPDTVVYKYRQPAFWYFTASNGRVRKKTKFNLNNVRIEETFCRRAAPTDIVGYYICTAAEEDGSESTTIEYFTPSLLHEFLYQRDKVNNGVLQRFVQPKGTSNSMIRAIYSPKICLVERRINIRKLTDHRFGLYERAVTYEGAEFHSHQAPVRGSLLPSQVQNLCNAMVQHVSKVSFRKHVINRMVCNFKVDAQDRLWLLWCTSCRVAPDPNLLRKRAVHTEPINIDSVVKLPKHVRLSTGAGMSVNSTTTAGGKPFDCPSCGRRGDSADKHETPYKAVITHFEQLVALLSAEMEALGRTDIEWPPEPAVIRAAGGVGFGGAAAAPPTGPVTESEVTIPPVLRALHPRLTVGDYKRYRRDPLFVHKVLHTCQECFLVYAQLLSTPVDALPSAVGVFGTGNFLGAGDPDRTGTLLMRSATTRQRQQRAAWASPHAPAVPAREPPPPPAGIVLNAIADARSHPELPPRVDLERVGSLAHEQMSASASAAQMLPGTLDSESESEGSGYSDSGGEDEEEEEPLEWQPPKVEPTPSLREREEAFFQDLYHNPNLSANHPLVHMVSAAAKLSNAKATLARANTSPAELIMERMAASATPAGPSSTASRGFGPLPPVAGMRQRTRTEASPYARVQSLLEPSRRRVRKPTPSTSTPMAATATLSPAASRSTPGRGGGRGGKKGKKGGLSASASAHRSFLLDTLKDVRTQLDEADEVVDTMGKGGKRRRRKSREPGAGRRAQPKGAPKSPQQQQKLESASSAAAIREEPTEEEEEEEEEAEVAWTPPGGVQLQLDGASLTVEVKLQGGSQLGVTATAEDERQWSLTVGGDELYAVFKKRLREVEDSGAAAGRVVDALRFVPPLAEAGPHTLCWADADAPQPQRPGAARQRLFAVGRKDGPYSLLYSIWTEVGDRFLVRATSHDSFELAAVVALTVDEVAAATGMPPAGHAPDEWCPRLLSKVSLVRPQREWLLDVEGVPERGGPVRQLFQRAGPNGSVLTALVVQDRFHFQVERGDAAGSVELLGWTTAGMNANAVHLFAERVMTAPVEELDSDQREARLRISRI